MNQFFSYSETNNMDGIAIAESLLYQDSEDVKTMMRLNNIPLEELTGALQEMTSQGDFSQLACNDQNLSDRGIPPGFGSLSSASGIECRPGGIGNISTGQNSNNFLPPNNCWSDNNSNANMNDFVNKLIQSHEDIPHELAGLSIAASVSLVSTSATLISANSTSGLIGGLQMPTATRSTGLMLQTATSSSQQPQQLYYQQNQQSKFRQPSTFATFSSGQRFNIVPNDLNRNNVKGTSENPGEDSVASPSSSQQLITRSSVDPIQFRAVSVLGRNTFGDNAVSQQAQSQWTGGPSADDLSLPPSTTSQSGPPLAPHQQLVTTLAPSGPALTTNWAFRPIRPHLDNTAASAGPSGGKSSGLLASESPASTPPPSTFEYGRPSPLPRPPLPSPVHITSIHQQNALHQMTEAVRNQTQQQQQVGGWTSARDPSPHTTLATYSSFWRRPNDNYRVQQSNSAPNQLDSAPSQSGDNGRVFYTADGQLYASCTTPVAEGTTRYQHQQQQQDVNNTTCTTTGQTLQPPPGYVFIPAGFLHHSSQHATTIPQQYTPAPNQAPGGNTQAGSHPQSSGGQSALVPQPSVTSGGGQTGSSSGGGSGSGTPSHGTPVNPQPLSQQQRLLNKRTQASMEFHTKFEFLVEQHKFLEIERKKTEADLVRQNPGKKISHINNVTVAKTSNNASRVDKELNAILANHARVVNLISKMEKLRNDGLPSNIHSAMDCWLEGIRKCQARRKEEMVNATNRQRSGGPRHQDDKDLVALAAALSELSDHMRRARTAVWAAMQMTDKDRAPNAQQALSYLAQLAAQSSRALATARGSTAGGPASKMAKTGGMSSSNGGTGGMGVITSVYSRAPPPPGTPYMTNAGARGGSQANLVHSQIAHQSRGGVMFTGPPQHYQLAGMPSQPSSTVYNMTYYSTPPGTASVTGYHHLV